jgi:hypothetical protein
MTHKAVLTQCIGGVIRVSSISSARWKLRAVQMKMDFQPKANHSRKLWAGENLLFVTNNCSWARSFLQTLLRYSKRTRQNTGKTGMIALNITARAD